MGLNVDRFEELEKLLSLLADDGLDAAGRERLGGLLDGDPEACEFYLDYMAMHAHLEQELGSMVPVQLMGKLPQQQIDEATTVYLATRQPPPPPVWKQPWTIAAAAAVVAGISLISVMTSLDHKPVSQEEVGTLDNAVAELVDTVDAVFVGDGLRPTRGELLPKGILRLESGLASLRFYSGAEVILEGPVAFELHGDNSAVCLEGKFRASVPRPAQGFTVHSPLVEMVDLGTQFGANISHNHATEVHVFEGEVEVYDTGSQRDPAKRNLLTAGYGLKIDAHGAKSDVLANPDAFISQDEVHQRMSARAEVRHAAWLAYVADSLSGDTRLMAHYPFISESTKSQELLDNAEAGGLRNGTIIGSQWVSGRWPGKRALAFTRPIDRVSINIKERSKSLTLVAWVKIDRLDERFSALLITDEAAKSGVEWQITRAGSLQFGLRKNQRMTENYTSPVLLRDRLGKWTQVAVSLDDKSRSVRHFVNGRLMSTQPLKSGTPPIIGPAQLGNWNATRTDDSYPVRYLHGRMDEFFIYKEALTDEEMRELYEIGLPPAGA